ncbi:hypothetical protein RCL1_001368 [Eukaryota sp. TZLM3-RCL]
MAFSTFFSTIINESGHDPLPTLVANSALFIQFFGLDFPVYSLPVLRIIEMAIGNKVENTLPAHIFLDHPDAQSLAFEYDQLPLVHPNLIPSYSHFSFPLNISLMSKISSFLFPDSPYNSQAVNDLFHVALCTHFNQRTLFFSSNLPKFPGVGATQFEVPPTDLERSVKFHRDYFLLDQVPVDIDFLFTLNLIEFEVMATPLFLFSRPAISLYIQEFGNQLLTLISFDTAKTNADFVYKTISDFFTYFEAQLDLCLSRTEVSLGWGRDVDDEEEQLPLYSHMVHDSDHEGEFDEDPDEKIIEVDE